MNKKGQQAIAGALVAIMIFIMAVQFITPLTDQASTMRNPSNLDCDNTSISLGEKSSCVMVDFMTFYYVGMALIGGAIFFGAKFLIGKAKQ